MILWIWLHGLVIVWHIIWSCDPMTMWGHGHDFMNALADVIAIHKLDTRKKCCDFGERGRAGFGMNLRTEGRSSNCRPLWRLQKMVLRLDRCSLRFPWWKNYWAPSFKSVWRCCRKKLNSSPTHKNTRQVVTILACFAYFVCLLRVWHW